MGTPDPASERDANLDRIPAALVRRGVDFIAIGGWAVQAQRLDLGYATRDVDLTEGAAQAHDFSRGSSRTRAARPEVVS